VVSALLIGAGCTVVVYLCVCAGYRKAPEIVSCVELILLGAGIPSGLHMIYCAFNPQSLVHITHEDGKRFDLAANRLTVTLGEYHAIEVFMGGFVGAFFCCVAIVTILKKPARPVEAAALPSRGRARTP
jgi:hypothetical protein